MGGDLYAIGCFGEACNQLDPLPNNLMICRSWRNDIFHDTGLQKQGGLMYPNQEISNDRINFMRQAILSYNPITHDIKIATEETKRDIGDTEEDEKFTTIIPRSQVSSSSSDPSPFKRKVITSSSSSSGKLVTTPIKSSAFTSVNDLFPDRAAPVKKQKKITVVSCKIAKPVIKKDDKQEDPDSHSGNIPNISVSILSTNTPIVSSASNKNDSLSSEPAKQTDCLAIKQCFLIHNLIYVNGSIAI